MTGHRFSQPLVGAEVVALSLGAGVQSTVLALMGARGDLPKPDFAVFADTGWEPSAVYSHLDWLESVLPYPVVRTKRLGRNLGDAMMALANGDVPFKGAPTVPFYTAQPTGMLDKQCSKEWKTRVVAAYLRERLGVAPGAREGRPRVEMWLGISLDEIQRMKRNEKPMIHNRWPLIELNMSRIDCQRWLAERQYRAPKSSCIFCPYRGDAQWRDMRDNHPEDWQSACAFDEAIRPGFSGMEGAAYVHRSRTPLAVADLKYSDALDLFENECEGLCGV